MVEEIVERRQQQEHLEGTHCFSGIDSSAIEFFRINRYGWHTDHVRINHCDTLAFFLCESPCLIFDRARRCDHLEEKDTEREP